MAKSNVCRHTLRSPENGFYSATRYLRLARSRASSPTIPRQLRRSADLVNKFVLNSVRYLILLQSPTVVKPTVI